MFGGALQPMHLVLILVIVLIIFGPGKLPDVGSAVGRTIREFKHSAAEPEEATPEEEAKAVSAPTASPPASKVCESCKTENPPDSSFCRHCGAALS